MLTEVASVQKFPPGSNVVRQGEEDAKSPELRRLLKAFQRDAWARIGRMDIDFDMGWMTLEGLTWVSN